MLKREPMQVSSEELDDNTELEQAKEVLRDEYSQAQDDNDRVSESKSSDSKIKEVSSEDEGSPGNNKRWPPTPKPTKDIHLPLIFKLKGYLIQYH